MIFINLFWRNVVACMYSIHCIGELKYIVYYCMTYIYLAFVRKTLHLLKFSTGSCNNKLFNMWRNEKHQTASKTFIP